jgi:hypothetical protein
VRNEVGVGPLDPELQEVLDGCWATLRRIREEAEQLVGPLEEPEPTEEEIASLSRIMANWARIGG